MSQWIITSWIIYLVIVLFVSGAVTASVVNDTNFSDLVDWNSNNDFNMKCSEDKEMISSDGQSSCCDKCDRGYGMVRVCTPSNTTVCEQCTGGITFNSEKSLKKCKPCRVCSDTNMVVEKECTIDRDTQCKCIRGYYLKSRNSQICSPCTKCRSGFGRMSDCTKFRDARCKQCPLLMYSQYISSEKNYKCRQCGTCQVGHAVEKQCNAHSDTICRDPRNGRLYRPNNWKELIDYGKIKNSRFNINGSATENQPPSTSIPHSFSDGNNLIPLYCAIMGLLIVGLVVYVIVKHWQRRQNGRMSAKSGLLPPSPRAPVMTGVTSSGTTTVPLLPAEQLQQPAPGLVQHQLPPHYQISLLGPQGKRKSVDSGLGSEMVSATTSTRKFREVCQDVKKRLEIALHADQPGNDWKALGHELGYTDTELASFESQAAEEHVPPCRCLLERWSAKSHSSVGALSRALSKLGRRDLVLLLREDRVTKNTHQHSPPPQLAIDMNPDQSSNIPICQV